MTTTQAPVSGIKAFRPIIIVFVLLNAGFFGARSLLAKWNIDANVLVIGNLILFVATTASFYFYLKSLQDNRAHTFVRFIYTGMFIKLGLCLVASFLYIMVAGKQVNKGGIIGCMAIYFLYTVMEVVILTKLSRQKKNV